ncbi:hypothetical protein Tco_1218340 [Tanacetum coccineum]
MFDEYFNPPPSAISPVQVADTPRAVDISESPVSTSIDQDAPSTSIPSTQEQEQSPILSQGVEESPKTPHFNDHFMKLFMKTQLLKDHHLMCGHPTLHLNFLCACVPGIRQRLITKTYKEACVHTTNVDVCMCARYQAKPTEKHLHEVKRIFRYLKGTIDMGLWYSKDSCISLTAYADADHAGYQDTRQSTSGSA